MDRSAEGLPYLPRRDKLSAELSHPSETNLLKLFKDVNEELALSLTVTMGRACLGYTGDHLSTLSFLGRTTKCISSEKAYNRTCCSERRLKSVNATAVNKFNS